MRQVVLIGALVGGILAAAGGLLSAAALALLALLTRQTAGGALLLGTLALAAGAFGAGLGGLLAWEAWRALAGAPSGRLRLPAWGWWLLALGVVLGLGQVAAAGARGLLLPPFHIIAAVLPAMLFFSLSLGGARRFAGGISARPALSSIAWGGLGGTGLAMLLEVVLAIVLALIVPPLLNIVAPGIVEHLQAMLRQMQQGAQPDMRLLMPYLRSPWVIGGTLLFVSVAVPLIEEAVKALAVPLVAMSGRTLTRPEAFLIGVAAGAGFAMVEGVTNGTLALSSLGGWGIAMAVRAGAAGLHCVVSGIAGLGWHAIIVERRWLRGLALGLAATLFHGLWNVGAAGSALLALQRGAGSGFQVAGNLLTLPVVALMGTLFLLALMILRWLPARLAATAGATDETGEPVST